MANKRMVLTRKARGTCTALGRSGRLSYERTVPAISIFFGIVIRMFYRDHEPAHFHAEYQGQRGKFDLGGKMLAGNIQSKTALRLIKQWAVQNESEIRANWRRMKAGKPLETIEPLR